MSYTGVSWESLPWHELIPRLLLYTAYRTSRKYWRGEESGSIASGKTVEDFVQQAIEKTLNGTRRWNPASFSLFEHLKSIIDSDVSHTASSYENRRFVRYSNLGEDIVKFTVDHASPADSVEAKEELVRVRNFLAHNYQDLVKVYDFMLVNEGASAGELAELLGVDIKASYSVQRRLRRALQSYLSTEGNNAVGSREEVRP